MANRSHKSFFMPLLCRFSINDTVKPTKFQNPTSLDPSSPKLSCTGKIKKRSTNNNVENVHHRRSYSLSNSTTAKSSIHPTRYNTFQKLFSSRNLIFPAIDMNTSVNNYDKCATKRSKSCNGRGGIPIINKSKYHHHMTTSNDKFDDHDFVTKVVTKELDPPLPVVKCCRRDQEVSVNLWKRRGFEMKTLQIQPIRSVE
ncbi:uncharacterized protein [Rutidosis leptorrhynchoides]|uniref:uncharacterized protein n=1 Tax=Rutidosis leptorrhynchoides TaxID=125765 RepID=UPI003A9978EF